MLLIVAACGSLPSGPPNYQPTLDSMTGRPVSELIAKMGTPTSTRVIDGTTWHTWERRKVANYENADYIDFYCKLDLAANQGLATQLHVTGDRKGCNALLRPFIVGPEP